MDFWRNMKVGLWKSSNADGYMTREYRYTRHESRHAEGGILEDF